MENKCEASDYCRRYFVGQNHRHVAAAATALEIFLYKMSGAVERLRWRRLPSPHQMTPHTCGPIIHDIRHVLLNRRVS